MKCKIFTTMMMVFALSLVASAQSFERQWDQSNSTGTMPAWANYLTRGIAATPDYLFIASRDSTSFSTTTPKQVTQTIVYLNATTGDPMGMLDVSTIPSSTWAINMIDVSDDDQILVCNLALYHETWVPDGTWDFKIYKWTDENATPELYLTYNNPDHMRLGDSFTVKGDLSGDAIIYAPATKIDKVVRWEVVGGVLNTTPEVITIAGISDLATLGFPKVAPTGVTKNDPFFYNATGTLLKEYNADGTLIGEIQKHNFLSYPGYYAAVDNAITTFELGGQTYVGALGLQQDLETSQVEAKAINVANGLTDAKYPFYSQSLGTSANNQYNGDICTTVINEEVWVYLLYSNSGYAAFKVNASVPAPEIPVTEAGWRMGSHPTLDIIDGNLSKPNWLDHNVKTLAVGNGHIYVASCPSLGGLAEVHILNVADGTKLDKMLNVNAVNAANAASDRRIADIEVDDAGHILACNMRLEGALNIFAWDDEDSAPSLLISADGIPYAEENDAESTWQQTSYTLDVKGDIKGDAVIIAARSNTAVTYKWVITGGVLQNEGNPYITINAIGNTDGSFGAFAAAALESADPNTAIWGNGQLINPMRFASDGSLLGAIPAEVATNTASTNFTTVTKYFEWESKNYLLEWNWVWADHCRLIDVTSDDLSTLTVDNQQEVGTYLGQAPNPERSGDVDFFIAEDGSLIIVTLVTNNGIRLDRYAGTGTAIAKVTKTQLKIFPNPAQNDLFVSHPAGCSEVEIINVAGAIVKIVRNVTTEAINVSDLKTGIYFVKATSNEGTVEVTKFMKK